MYSLDCLLYMKFRSLFIAHVPDADPGVHHTKLGTDKYILYVNFVTDQKEALKCAELHAKDKGIHSIILCPGFTHLDVAEISAAVKGVGVTVARGDGPSGRIAKKAMEEANWFE